MKKTKLLNSFSVQKKPLTENLIEQMKLEVTEKNELENEYRDKDQTK